MSLPVLPPVVEVGKPRSFNANYVLLWNNVALDLVRLVHSLSGQQSGPPLTARALGILHLAIHDAYFAVFPYKAHEPHNPKLDDILPYLSTTQLQQAEKMSPNPTASPIATSADRSKASKQAMSAVAGAAVTVFVSSGYPQPFSAVLSVGRHFDDASEPSTFPPLTSTCPDKTAEQAVCQPREEERQYVDCRNSQHWRVHQRGFHVLCGG